MIFCISQNVRYFVVDGGKLLGDQLIVVPNDVDLTITPAFREVTAEQAKELGQTMTLALAPATWVPMKGEANPFASKEAANDPI